MNARATLAATLLTAMAAWPLHAQTLPQAQALADRGAYAAAADLLERRLAETPEDAESRFLLARVLAWNGEPARALPLYEALLARGPDNADYLLGYGQALLWSGQRERAVAVLERAQRLAPDYAEVARALAQARANTTAAETPPRPLAAPTPTPKSARDAATHRSVALSAHRAWLDNGYDDWRGARLDVVASHPGQFGGYGALVAEHRFGRADHGIEGGLLVPLPRGWTLQTEAGIVPGAEFLPEHYLDLRLQREFGGGWIGTASLRRSEYPDTRVERLAVGIERYFGPWRAGYTVNLTRLEGSHSVSHDLRLARGYGERSEVGVQLVSGREAALLATGVVAGEVRAATVFGRHALGPDWSLMWNLGATEQGKLYTRRGLTLGLERRF